MIFCLFFWYPPIWSKESKNVQGRGVGLADPGWIAGEVKR